MSRTCCVCGGITFAPVDGNNWICVRCWDSHCQAGIPDWIRYLVNQTRYEGRQSLGERVSYNRFQYPEVRLTGRGHTCSISLINEADIERVFS